MRVEATLLKSLERNAIGPRVSSLNPELPFTPRL